MGVIATVAGGLAVLFPETLGRYLLRKLYSQNATESSMVFSLQEVARDNGGGP